MGGSKICGEEGRCSCGHHGGQSGGEDCCYGGHHEHHSGHHHHSDCGCGGHHGGGYGRHGQHGSGSGGHGFHRRFRTREEQAADLESYLKELEAEAQAVREEIARLRAQ
ncbi:MAG: hypothetical protein M1531_12590 [Chloroflexi bacterium]|nr:hypothetical protein [Chloroflexota bacterium]